MGDQRWEMGKGENGHWTLDLSDFGWVIDLSQNNECELTESDSAFYQLSVRHDNTLFTLRFFHQLILTTES